ncbi:hypothetical protein SAMN05421790_101146 [Kroppenstedtia eburnea]|uniref:Uncharacterized protein n=1 Tax=Kroppenstedtia eburnea TaxID=714067 RepID=A0A1N7INH0_9BACL|nr:hypothetical protein SAMN05421790_101146 [Kroppenstedtia eburnea]
MNSVSIPFHPEGDFLKYGEFVPVYGQGDRNAGGVVE